MASNSLPVNTSLASALALHGAPINQNPAGSSGSTAANAKQSLGSRNTRTKTSIHALAVHPSFPHVAYMKEETTTTSTTKTNASTSSSSKKKNAATHSSSQQQQQHTTIKSQHIIIQQYSPNPKNNNSNFTTKTIGNNKDPILATLPMEHLPSAINKFRQPKSKSSKISNAPLTLATIGQLQSISFLDRTALFWETTRRQYGSLSNLDRSTSALVNGGSDGDKEEVVLSADSDLNSEINGGGTLGHGLTFGLQFARVLVVIRFNTNNSSNSDDSVTVLCCLEGQRTNTGKETKVQYTPTSAILPLSNSIVVYGCSDGAMRFHNLVPSMLLSNKSTTDQLASTHFGGAPSSPSSNSSNGSSIKSSKQMRQATIKSVRGPNGRNDPVVKIVNVDPAYNESNASASARGEMASSSLGGIPTQVSANDGVESNDTILVLKSRLLTVCASGVAFLWDVNVMIDRASGALRDLNVLPPLVRLDGLGSLTVSPRKTPASSSSQSRVDEFWSGITPPNSKEAAPYSTVTPSVSYDPHRNLLVWSLPSNAPVSSIDHRGDYELESSAPNSSKAKQDAEDRVFISKWSSENGGFVKVWDLSMVDGLIHPPSTTPRPPAKIPPAAILKLPTSVSSAASPLSMIASLIHAPITTTSLACVFLSRDGSKLSVLAAPLHSAVEDTSAEAGTQSLSSGSPSKRTRKKPNTGLTKPKVMFANYTPCHSVSLAGDGMSPFTRGSGLSASCFVPDLALVATDQGVAIASLTDGETWSSNIKLLAGQNGTMGASRMDSSSSQSGTPPNVLPGPIHTIISVGGVGNRPGVLYVENHAVYASRLSTIRLHNDHKQALVEKIDLHDPLMLCKLHEHGKVVPLKTVRSTRRANIIESSQTMKCSPRLIYSPSGRYLCLYWEDQKRYEILHAGSLLSREQNNPTSTDGQGLQVTPSVDSGSNVLSFAWVGDDDNFATLRRVSKKSKPQVELFKLAEVEVDAVELQSGASVAAATTVSLGSLSLRGGDRFIPNVLFGGPALCVGCISGTNNLNSIDNDDIAYFYSSSVDERASAYSTIGTSIPYPDLVAWDDVGQLCATSYGSRVAVYRSEKSQFVLLGSVQVGVTKSSHESAALVSMKFIHGVLYCSTQSTVHAIFLGNIELEDSVCEMDAFVVATDGVSLYGIDNPDVCSPVPVITALMRPHILAYYSGGLLVSTTCGLRLLPLSHPTIRIGTLLAANLIERARKWIFAVHKSEHDYLAEFLIRRGHADLAISDLNGLSLETYIDLCMRYERTDELEHLLLKHGSQIIPEISDWGRGVNGGYSAYQAIGMFMLGKDKIECTKKLIALAIESGITELLVDAMKLGAFVAALDKREGGILNEVTNAMNFDANEQLALINIVN